MKPSFRTRCGWSGTTQPRSDRKIADRHFQSHPSASSAKQNSLAPDIAAWLIGRVTTLLIATRNAHKVGEIRAILGGSFRYLTLNDYPSAPGVVENAVTFAGNATKKAVELARWVGDAIPHPAFVLADDSGLEVDALGGAPGVHSARFAALDSGHAGNSPDADNNDKLLRLLQNVPAEKRTARFRCVIALVAVIPHSALRTPQLFDGACEGRIDFAPRGDGGFGYDPLFIPESFTQSFAELGEETKNQLSHRAKALAKLKDYFRNNPSR